MGCDKSRNQHETVILEFFSVLPLRKLTPLQISEVFQKNKTLKVPINETQAIEIQRELCGNSNKIFIDFLSENNKSLIAERNVLLCFLLLGQKNNASLKTAFTKVFELYEEEPLVDTNSSATAKNFREFLSKYVALVTGFAYSYCADTVQDKNAFAAYCEIQYQDEFRKDFVKNHTGDNYGNVNFDNWLLNFYGKCDEIEVRDAFNDIAKRIIEDRMKNGPSLESMGFGKFAKKKEEDE